jgi:hypothetical protein
VWKNQRRAVRKKTTKPRRDVCWRGLVFAAIFSHEILANRPSGALFFGSFFSKKKEQEDSWRSQTLVLH